MRPQTVGAIRVERLVEYEEGFEPTRAFPDYDPAVTAANRSWLAPHFVDFAQGTLTFSFHSFVVRTPRHAILIDTCVGNDKPRAMPQWHMQKRPYLENLAKLGLRPGDIDYVMCTHLHGDHVGWNTRLDGGRWVPTFPKARYIFSKADYDYYNALKPGEPGYDRIDDSVRPIVKAGQAAIVGYDFALEDDVSLYPTPGHTPGHYCVHLTSGGRQALMTGDLMHHPVQVNRPEWSSNFCRDPNHSRRTRRKFVHDHADRDVVVFAAHFAGATAGRIVSRGERCQFHVLDGA
jgi:glyoxylase-like metal-dependent hydrolase (beta-lactamase superfamily II)